MTHTLATEDPLWVPLLTHYREDGAVDHERMARHLESIRGAVSQIMLAGSTGDGWEMDDERFDSLIEFAAERTSSDIRIMFGVLQPHTDGVIARLKRLEGRISASPALASRFVGATICPPIDSSLNEAGILAHYRRVLAESSCPIAVYQLPQVTGCRIAPETLAALADEPRVVMFKDSSGEDAIAKSGRDFGRVMMVRGAEGGYVEAVAGMGYHGWLLSTANIVPEALRRIETLLRGGDQAEAADLSSRLSAAINELFALAGSEGGANAFSNANRAGDHVRAYGDSWPDRPLPLKQDVNPLSRPLIEAAERLIAPFLDGASPYLGS